MTSSEQEVVVKNEKIKAEEIESEEYQNFLKGLSQLNKKMERTVEIEMAELNKRLEKMTEIEQLKEKNRLLKEALDLYHTDYFRLAKVDDFDYTYLEFNPMTNEQLLERNEKIQNNPYCHLDILEEGDIGA